MTPRSSFLPTALTLVAGALLLPVTLHADDVDVGARTKVISGKTKPAVLITANKRVKKIELLLTRDDGKKVKVVEVLCEGCGACAQVCGEEAVSFRPNRAGLWTTRATPWGTLVHATLGVAQDSSGKLVALLRREARRLAARDGVDLVLIDGPPGIGCPVHAAITGVDGVVVVTEPTEAGIHDLARVLTVIGHFGLPSGIVLNKADLNAPGAHVVETVASVHQVPLLGSIPFESRLPGLLGRQETGLEIDGVREAILACWRAVGEVLGDSTHLALEPVAAGADHRRSRAAGLS